MEVILVVIVHPPIAAVKVITVVPADEPDTTPVTGSMVATDDTELLHVPPPGSESLNVIVDPIQTFPGPIMAGGGVQLYAE